MITVKEIKDKTMTPEKRKSAKYDFFAFYIGRPITYVLTIPFLYINISPNTVTWMSFVPVFLGLILMWFGDSTAAFLGGWFCFFMWSMLDGVDGNIARYKKEYSILGSTLDAMAGYYAMSIIPLAAGISAAHYPGLFTDYFGIPTEVYIILGALSGLWVILPRLTMHKAINSTGKENVGGLKERQKYNVIRILALNLTSPPGAVQLLLLASVFANTLDLYTVGYFIINTFVMIMSMHSLFKKEE